jgi:hypothetical protein
MALLQQIVLMYCSQVFACQAMHQDVDHIGAMHVVLYSALQRAEMRIQKLLASSERDRVPWLLKPGVMDKLVRIEAQCKVRPEFSPDKGLERLIELFEQRAAQTTA